LRSLANKRPVFCNIPNNDYAFNDYDMLIDCRKATGFNAAIFPRNRTLNDFIGDSQAVLATMVFKLQGYWASLQGFFTPFIARISLRRFAASVLFLSFKYTLMPKGQCERKTIL